MFFSQDILQRRGGKFGIVWIAATKFRTVQLTRREYLAVCVPKTCDDIVRYICLDAQPLRPHGPRPRLSLYLSSQLMFGVTRVYRKQMDIFNAEVHDLYMRFSTAKLTLEAFEATDLGQTKQHRGHKYMTGEFCTLQDPMISEESDFGVMRFEKSTTIDPSQLPYIDFIQDLSPLFPAFPPSDQSSSPQLGIEAVPMDVLLGSPHTVSNSSQISIKEIPETSMPTIPGESDLQALEPVEEFLQHMQDAVGIPRDTRRPRGPEKKPRDPRQPGKPPAGKKARKMGGLEELLPFDDQPASSVAEDLRLDLPELSVEHRQPAALPADDQMDVTADRPMDTSADQSVGQIPAPLFPSLDSPAREDPAARTTLDILQEEPIVPPEPATPKLPTQIPILRLTPLLSPGGDASPPQRRRAQPGRRRQLQFADVVDDFTQLSKQSIRENLATSNELCRTLYEALPSSAPGLTAKELLILPGRRSITKSETLMGLWKKHAVPYRPEGVAVDEIPTYTWSTEYLLAKSDEEMAVEDPRQDNLVASPEQLRDISVESVGKRLRFEETPSSFAISDVSRLSESRDSTQPSSFHLETGAVRHKRRLTEQSIEEEVQGRGEEAASLPGMGLDDIMPPLLEDELQGVPEVVGRSPEVSSSDAEQQILVPHPNMLRRIAKLTAADETVTFKEVIPLRTHRSVAGKVFSVCLEYAALELIKMDQEIAYGDIYIRRGLLF